MHTPAALHAPVAPAAALHRIAMLQERVLGDTRRIQAYRRAAAAIAELSHAELTALAERGKLTDLPGVGSSTSAAILEALSGAVPARLAALQQEATPLEAGGAALFAAIIGDCHVHSEWSDGSAPVAEMAQAAIELGQQWMVLTDHSPNLRVARGLSAERLTQQLQLVAELNSATPDFRILTGIEVDILEDGTLDQDDTLRDSLDVVTASVHSQLRMPAGQMTRRMLRAIREHRVNVLGHCTGRKVLGKLRPQSEFDARRVFEACAEAGTAVEINSRPERVDPPDELIALALEIGCVFAIDSDAHAPGQLEMKAHGAERAERLGIPAERIVTTWDADRMLAWSRR